MTAHLSLWFTLDVIELTSDEDDDQLSLKPSGLQSKPKRKAKPKPKAKEPTKPKAVSLSRIRTMRSSWLVLPLLLQTTIFSLRRR